MKMLHTVFSFCENVKILPPVRHQSPFHKKLLRKIFVKVAFEEDCAVYENKRESKTALWTNNVQLPKEILFQGKESSKYLGTIWLFFFFWDKVA